MKGIRKSAHVIEYAVFAVLIWRARRLAVALPRWATGSLAALLLVVVLAAFDEGRQHRISSRTGSTRDVVLDTAGGALGLGCAALYLAAVARSRKRPSTSHDPTSPSDTF